MPPVSGDADVNSLWSSLSSPGGAVASSNFHPPNTPPNVRPHCPQILPEREYTAPQDAVAVLLDAEGHTAPAGQGLASQSCAMSSILDDALRDFNFGSKEQGAPSSGGEA